jgi:hypothetical protein
VLDLDKPGSGAEAKLEAEISRALDKGAEAIVLGCAGMADLAQKLSRKFDVPVIDGVAAAVKQAEALAGLKLMTSRRGSYASPGVKKYDGMLAPFAPKTSGSPRSRCHGRQGDSPKCSLTVILRSDSPPAPPADRRSRIKAMNSILSPPEAAAIESRKR